MLFSVIAGENDDGSISINLNAASWVLSSNNRIKFTVKQNIPCKNIFKFIFNKSLFNLRHKGQLMNKLLQF